VASSKSRQRDLARAKFHRQMARRAAAERRRRQIQAGVGAGLAVVLIVVGAVWLFGGFDREKKPTASDQCLWTPARGAGGAGIKDVGMPPTTGNPSSGTRPMNITFSAGLVTTELDLAQSPCTAASFAYLASKNFFDNTSCHRMTDKSIYVLQCGDPGSPPNGSGGPSYQFADEYLPAAPEPSAEPSPSAAPDPNAGTVIYPAGTLAMANSGTPGTNGSQFFIVWKDSPFPPSYTIFGRITQGLDNVLKIVAGGHDGSFDPQPGGGKPKNEALIQSLTVGEVAAAAPTVAPPSGTAPSGSPAPSPLPST